MGVRTGGLSVPLLVIRLHMTVLGSALSGLGSLRPVVMSGPDFYGP
jgi:hypothetical protein